MSNDNLNNHGRNGFKHRSVITTRPESTADELHMPWAFAVKTYKEEIEQKLFKAPYSYTEVEIAEIMTRAAIQYDDEVNTILLSLI